MKHNLPSTIYASIIRIHPKTCQLACVMRAEVYGCFDGKLKFVKVYIIVGLLNDV